MNKLNTSILSNKARALFEALSGSSELEGFTLIGGTALALQIGHRVSLDFDFASFEQGLATGKIDALISRLKSQSDHSVHEIVDPEKESRFRINYGDSLRNFARDYVINNIKLTFFAHGKNKQQRDFYSDTVKIQNKDMTFQVLGLEGLKASKILVLADRVKSRDLYDLMILIKEYDYTLEAAFEVIKEIGHLDDPEYYRAVLIGTIPLDKDDEGLMPVGVECDVTSIYEFFENEFDTYDIKKAARLYADNKNK